MVIKIAAVFWMGASMKQKSLLSKDPSPPAQSQSQPPVVKADWAGSGNFQQQHCWQTEALDRYEDNNIFITGMSICGHSRVQGG